MSNNYRSLPHQNDEDINISLPIKKKELGNFIGNLLGQKQTIERYLEENFDIDHDWLINLHELIHQRIYQQADANLVSFSAVIYLEGGLKRSFTTIESFKNYTETKKEIPTGVKIIWNYLIQFPGKDYPEKQQIAFSAHIHSRSEAQDDYERNYFHIESIILDAFFVGSQRSTINFQIDHTERTWGDDIEVIISNHVDKAIRDNGLFGSLFEISRLFIALMILLFTMFYPITYNASSHADVLNDLLASYSSIDISNTDKTEIIIEKLDHLTLMVKSLGARTGGIFNFISAFILGPLVTIIFLRFTRRQTNSFLVLSTQSEKNRTKLLNQERRSVYILLGSFVFAVLTGIIANFGYAWLSSL